MSSYIRYMFKYLFEPEALPAELASEQRQASGLVVGSAASDSPGGASSANAAPLNSPALTSDELRLANQSGMPAPALATNKSAGAALVDWLWEAASASGAADDHDPQAPTLASSPAAPAWQMNATSARLAPWPSKCLELARMFTAALATTTTPPATTTTTASSAQAAAGQRVAGSAAAASVHTSGSSVQTGPALSYAHLGSFAKFEHLIRQRQLLAALAQNSTPAAAASASATHHWPATNNNWNSTVAAAWPPNANQIQQQQAVSSLELLECYNQLQLSDYYQSYDIFVGLRIATSLFILFSVFLLFVIYKTGCAGAGERASRSQLRLTGASSGFQPAASARKLPLIKRRPSARCKCELAAKKSPARPTKVQTQQTKAQAPLELAQDAHASRPPDLETGQQRRA